MKPQLGIDSISTDSVTRSASSGSDPLPNPASRSRRPPPRNDGDASGRLRLEERREKLRMLARHGSGDSSNRDGDGGKKGKSRPVTHQKTVIHVSRGSRLFHKSSAASDDKGRRRRSWSPENRGNRNLKERDGRRSSSFRADERRASRDQQQGGGDGSRPRGGMPRSASRRHSDVRRSESSGRLERARKPSSVEPRGPNRRSSQPRVVERRASFDERKHRLERSASEPASTTTATKARPRPAAERIRHHESRDRSSRVSHVDRASARRPVSANGRQRDRPAQRDVTSLHKDDPNRPVSRRTSSGQPPSSSREAADRTRILHPHHNHQSSQPNADRKTRAPVRQADNHDRSKRNSSCNDARAVEKLTLSRETARDPVSTNHKSDTDRTKEALRQANVTLLSSQLIHLNLKSEAKTQDKTSSSPLNETALVPVPPPAPMRPIGRLRSCNRGGMPVLAEEMHSTRSSDRIDAHKKRILGEANERIASRADEGHKSRSDEEWVAHEKHRYVTDEQKETRFMPTENKVHNSLAVEKIQAREGLNDDDGDDNVSIDVCFDTNHSENDAQLDRRVSPLTMRESDWKLDLSSSFVKFDESNGTTAQDVTVVERGTSSPATRQGFTNESLVVKQDSDTIGEGNAASNMDSDDKVSVHSQEKTSEWQQRDTYDESTDVIEIDDLDDSIIDSPHNISKRLRRRLSSMNDSTVTEGTSILEAVPQVNNMSLRALADHLTGRKAKVTSTVSHIDAESTSSFFADVSASDTMDQGDHRIRSKKVDEIVQKISKCRGKSSQNIQEPSRQAGNIGDAKKTASLTATASKNLLQKFPPPPPRRTHQITCAANQQPDMVPSPPPRNPQLVRSTQDGCNGTPLSPSQSKTKVSSPRPPPPPMLNYRKHASTGTAVQQTSSQPIAQAPPAPPLYGKHASTGSPTVDAASQNTQRTDAVDHLLSQLQNVDGIPPADNQAYRRSTSGGSVKNDKEPATTSILRRRNSIGVMSNIKNATNTALSGEVSDMPYRDSIGGGYGVYTGQVDQWGRPHGQGKILYTSGGSFEGIWVNGVRCQTVPPYQQGTVSNFNGAPGDVNPYYLMAPSGYGGVPPSNYYNTSQFNTSMNSFNHSMNWDYW
ncbi:hypothetical protein HJC23_006280 [Cyclotella cryptica]|uniref:Uncharacterized protein n=1 Tax=Cyclotella cryptica TaxID=29204 RepID=A0ABD3P1X9_9STRA|eukprot:CCRYP_018130-RA/>CCRYP_018130-RA protein AED:0.05 eAED:0.05 QI:0/-1/0/1/-1/1/1/0/1115